MEADSLLEFNGGKSMQGKKRDSEVVVTDTGIFEFEFFDSDAIDSSLVEGGKTEVTETDIEDVVDKIFDAATSGKTKDLSKLIFASHPKEENYSERTLNKTKRVLHYPLKRKSGTDLTELPKRPCVKTVDFKDIQNTLTPGSRDHNPSGEFVPVVPLQNSNVKTLEEKASLTNKPVSVQSTDVIEKSFTSQIADVDFQNSNGKPFRDITPSMSIPITFHPALPGTAPHSFIPVQLNPALPVETVNLPQKMHDLPQKQKPSQRTIIDFSVLTQAITETIENCFKINKESKIKLVLYCNELPVESFAIFKNGPLKASNQGMHYYLDKLTAEDLSSHEELKKRLSQARFESLLAEKLLHNSKEAMVNPKGPEDCPYTSTKLVSLLDNNKETSNIDGDRVSKQPESTLTENITENNSSETAPKTVKCQERDASSKEKEREKDTSKTKDVKKMNFPIIQNLVETPSNTDDFKTEEDQVKPIASKKIVTVTANSSGSSTELTAEQHVKHLRIETGNVKDQIIDAFIDKSKKNPVVVLHTLKLDSTSTSNSELVQGTSESLTDRKQVGEIEDEAKVAETNQKANETLLNDHRLTLTSENIEQVVDFVKEEINIMEEEEDKHQQQQQQQQKEAKETTGKLVIDESVDEPLNDCSVSEMKDSNNKTAELSIFDKGGPQLYECDICSKVFRLKRYVTRHKREVHCKYSYNVTDYPEHMSKINPKIIKKRLRPKTGKSNTEQFDTSDVEEPISQSEEAFIDLLLNKSTEVGNIRKPADEDDKTTEVDNTRKLMGDSDDNVETKRNRINDLYSLARKEKRGEQFEIYPVYVCEHCGKFYRGKKSLKEHFVREHATDTNQEPLYVFISTDNFNCPICFKSYADPYQLVTHAKEHTNDHQPVCVLCGKTYSSVTVLKRHIDSIHREIRPRPFKCKLCDYAASNRWHLREHLRRHTGDKPFQCPVCLKYFSHQGTMNRHCKIKHYILATEPKRLFYPEGDPNGKFSHIRTILPRETTTPQRDNSHTVLRLNNLASANQFVPVVPVGPLIHLTKVKTEVMDENVVNAVVSAVNTSVNAVNTARNAVNTGGTTVDESVRVQGDSALNSNASLQSPDFKIPEVKTEPNFSDIVIKQEPEDY